MILTRYLISILRSLPRGRDARTWVLALGSLALMSGCGDGPTEPEMPVALEVRVANGVLENARFVNVRTSTATAIDVEYWLPGGDRLRVSAEPSLQHSIFLPRLKFGKTYSYAVYAAGTLRSEIAIGDLSTDSLPSDLLPHRPLIRGTMTPPVVMIEMLRRVPGDLNGFLAVDRDGDIVWYFRGRPNGFTLAKDTAFVLLEDLNKELLLVSPEGRVLQRQTVGGAHHDVTATSRGTFLFLAQVTETVSDTTWVGESIKEWDPATNSVTERWNAFRFLDPRTDRGVRSVPSDWLHANALSIGPRGNAVMSLPSLNQVISIAPDFLTIEWRLGGPNASHPLSDNPSFSFQHTAAEIAPGRVLLFDNARDDFAKAQGSGAVEYFLDPVTRRGQKVWEYRPVPLIWAPIVGATTRMANGNTMIAFGPPAGLLGATGPTSVQEITTEKQEVWRLGFERPTFIYRATPLKSIGGEIDVESGSSTQ